MNAILCPDPATLEAYLLGTLDTPVGESIDSHLDDCAHCIATVDALDAAVNQPFLRLGAFETPRETEPDLQQLVARAKQLTPGTHDAESLAGQTLGNYQLQEMIGVGGMGRVYRAQHSRLKKTVAVKVLAPALLSSHEARQRFQREIEAVGRLASPHIVTALDAGQVAGRDFLVMEYVEGRTLAQIVQADGPLPTARAISYVRQAALGLAHAHAAGIIHRDVKPSNLLVDNSGIVKLLDLGLARIRGLRLSSEAEAECTSPSPTYATTTGAIMGTVAFMAPEQASAAHPVDERADVYSLGCTLYFLLTGKPPYEGASPREALAAHHDQPIPTLPEPRVNEVLKRMLAKAPADRLPSMDAVLAALEEPRPRAQRRWIAGGVALAACVALVLTFWSTAGIGEQKQQGPAPTIDMVRIAAGEFWMGASETDLNAQNAEKPRQKVKLNRSFLLGKTEVTQAQYVEVMGSNPSAFSSTGMHRQRVKNVDTSNHPVESVSWFDAVRFCNKLSERHELKPYYQIKDQVVTIRGGEGYRLPTEAEWEYACRAGTSTSWSFGEKIGELGKHAWFAENSDDRTHPVGKKSANPFGLHDMYGNVREWCWDRFDPGYYASMPASDPAGSGTANLRAIRGGGWNTRLPRTSAREGLGLTYGAEGSINIVGFRVARSIDP